MRSVEEHLETVLAGVDPLEHEDVALLDALGQTLAVDVVAPWPLPPFDNSSMDGYAVRAEDVAWAAADAPVRLPVVADLAAGTREDLVLGPGVAARIMTGAPIPPGADCVVPVERTDGGTEVVTITEGVDAGAFVRRAGDDVPEGTVVGRAGEVVTERSIAVLASVGRGRLSVVRRPHVVVISTGDELVEPGAPMVRGQIADSNGVMLTALARAAGASAWKAPRVHDDDGELRAVLDAALRNADVVVTSGGVSMGAYDTVKSLLSASGEVDFVKVAQHPGMPQGAGHLGPNRVPIVTLPGNPVSSFISFELYVRPLIRRLMGKPDLLRTEDRATCTVAFDSPTGKRQFVRAVLDVHEDGSRTVRPVGGQGSHVVGGLAMADALVVVPPEVGRVEAGDQVTVLDLLRSQP
ncbi:MAG TPA: gephyrin-like molybdotransferase Glp [Candidatus Nanopelagicales bacterium]|nr:gephyrin-like molybdotransferase Glp [Candidatus Nanopelagicales bacterium]